MIYSKTIFYNESYTIHNAHRIVTHPKFRLAYMTIVYMHGYSDGANNRSVKSVANAYLQRGNYNIIALDYADLVAERYFREALPNTLQVRFFSFFHLRLLHRSLFIFIYLET